MKMPFKTKAYYVAFLKHKPKIKYSAIVKENNCYSKYILYNVLIFPPDPFFPFCLPIERWEKYKPTLWEKVKIFLRMKNGIIVFDEKLFEEIKIFV